MTNIRCVTYKDNYSADKCAYNDLEIGCKHKVVGCGNKVFGGSKNGDIVIINATKDGIKHVVIGELSRKLESCDKWRNAGGHSWEYNWEYIPLTREFEYDSETKRQVNDICTNQLNSNILFNSRFCSKKFMPVVEMLIEKFKILD
jgi:hypothetical protein